MQRFRDQSEPRVVLVTSYPRSGSNWVGQVMRLLESAHARINPDRVGLFHDLEVVRLEVDVEAYLYPGPAPLVFFKTHELPAVVFERSPGLRGEVRAAINIVRHPLDVMVSSLRWSLWAGRVFHEGRAVRTMDEARALGLLDGYVEHFLAHRGAPDFAASGYGTWPEHARAWGGERAEGVPILRARYRDLVGSPVESFGRLARGLGIEVGEEEMERAIAGCTPERIGAPFGAGFIHRAGESRYTDTLSPGQIERGLAVFADDIRRLGL